MTILPNKDYKISEIDFYNDWIEQLRQRLLKQGYNVAKSTDGFEVCKQYFGLLHRMISSRPRKIAISKELVCPPEVQSGFEIFKKKVEGGDDLNPHLNKGSRKLDFNDGLLNEWGIYHFHLDTVIMPDGFIKRTGPVLFAKVTSDVFYCIAIMEHGRSNPEVWSEQDMIEIVHNNWPDIIEQYKTDFLTMDKTDRATRHNLRKSRVNSFVEVNDRTIYSLPGGGSMLDGTNAKVIMTHDHNAYILSQQEQRIRDNIANIASEIHASTGYDGNEFTFQLVLSDNEFFVEERNSKSCKLLFSMIDFISA